MVDCTPAIFSQSVRPAAACFAISLIRPSGEKKQTFSVVSLHLTVQLPCLNVFSFFILPLTACKIRSLDDVSTVGAGAERGVNTRKRTGHRKAFDRRRFVLACPSPRPDQRLLLVCSPRSRSELRELVDRSLQLSIGCVRRITGPFAAQTRKVVFFPFKPSSILL